MVCLTKKCFTSHFVTGAPRCDLMGGPIQLLNKVPGDWLTVYIDIKFSCQHSRIVRHEFYANSAGRAYIGAWRKVPNTEDYKLIGFNTIIVSEIGRQV